MGVFEHFPYVNFHELNFSWMIEKIKELEDIVGSQIVDIVARAGVAVNTQAINDLTTTVNNNAITAHNEALAASNAAATADGKAVTAQNTADANTAKINKINTILNIFDQKNIPTVATEYLCNWQNYNLLVIEAVQYGNKRATVVAPYLFFYGTNSGSRVQLYDPLSQCTYDVYQGGSGKIFVASSSPGAALGVVIYGVDER